MGSDVEEEIGAVVDVVSVVAGWWCVGRSGVGAVGSIGACSTVDGCCCGNGHGRVRWVGERCCCGCELSVEGKIRG